MAQDAADDAAARLIRSEPVWSSCAWLSDFAADDAMPWPRLMSPPHPDAIGTLGAAACDWIEANSVTRKLRAWQRLVIYRILEVNRDGELCWLDALISTPRQVGKSVVVCALAFWRLHQLDRFGEEQLVMHTGKDLNVCREVQRPARSHAKTNVLRYRVREANGQEEIATRDGCRWIIRGTGSVYGYGVSFGIVDEGWGVHAEAVEDGIEPTMAEREQSQLMLISTAHRRATSLMPLRRQTVIETIMTNKDSLIIEWSATRTAEITDRDAWRAASPHWSRARERMLEAKLERAMAGVSDDPDEDDPIESFRAQFLNIWPARRLSIAGRDEPLIPWDAWEASADVMAGIPASGNVVAVEDFYGTGAAACAAGKLPDGRVLVWGDVFQSRAEAWAWAAYMIGQRPDTRLIVGASLAGDTAISDLGALSVDTAGSVQTRTSLPLVRELLTAGQLAHSGGMALTAQVQQLRVVNHREGGLGVSSRSGRNDLARSMAWAINALVNAPEALPFFVH
jgi:hypothetical protein